MNSVILNKISIQEPATILSRIAGDDKKAARECIEIYGAMIWALVKQSVHSTEAAENVVQEIFLDIWENAAFCDLKISDEKNWIAMIANRRLSGLSASHKPLPIEAGDYILQNDLMIH